MKTENVNERRAPDFQQTLDRIYDAAFDSSAFEKLSMTIAQCMEAANGVVVLARNGVPIELSATTSQQAQQDYLAYYGQIDVWTPSPGEVVPGVVTRTRDRLSEDEVLNSEFYRDYARHLDMWQPIGITRMLGPDSTLIVGVNRTRSGQDFSKHEELRLAELTSHLQRALQMRTRFQNLEARAQTGFAALDALAFAAVAADAAGRIIFANAKAEELHRVQAGLTLGGGRVGCAVQSQSRELHTLIRNAANGGAGGAMRMTDSAGAGALLGLVTPLPHRLNQTGNGAGLALVAVRPGRDSPAFAEKIVTQLFGLSRSEAQVVCALAAGATLEEIAVQRGVKMTTVKTQLEAAFRKTETDGQRDLLRLIGTLPQLR